MPGLLTYWHTVRHLSASQIYGRLWRRLVPPRVDTRPAPPLRARTNGWVAPASRRASMLGPTAFRFLNETHDLERIGWDSGEIAKLWRYNLHYGDDLNADGAAARVVWHRQLIARWMDQNRAPAGTGWEPYPTSQRIVNWVKWALAGNELPGPAVANLAVQARLLRRTLETHLRGNHLFANAKALAFAGMFFDGPEATDWLDTACAILHREIPEQILSDGGQFERSSMYHALAVEDVLDLLNVGAAFDRVVSGRWQEVAGALRERIGGMREFLRAMCHPDGEIAFFNDAAIGIAPSPAALEAYAARLGMPAPASSADATLTVLEPSGFVRVNTAGAVALLDVGPIGPDYLPAHGHADTLSFELSLGAQRVFVNSGTSRYGTGPERERERGTAAHNTVVVDGADSSEVWGGFRVARRARPFGLSVSSSPVVVQCAHDGYRRLPGRVSHHRTWAFDGSTLVIDDRISGRFGRAEARFHVHPDVRVTADPGGADATLEAGAFSIHIHVDGGSLRPEPAPWHPEFGVTIPATCLVIDFASSALRTRIEWARL